MGGDPTWFGGLPLGGGGRGGTADLTAGVVVRDGTIRPIDLGQNWDAHLPAILMAKSLVNGRREDQRSGGNVENRSPVYQCA